jgi:hypothetical protein
MTTRFSSKYPAFSSWLHSKRRISSYSERVIKLHKIFPNEPLVSLIKTSIKILDLSRRPWAILLPEEKSNRILVLEVLRRMKKGESLTSASKHVGLTKYDLLTYIRNASKGKLAFLTTISPEMEENERYFIGILDIKEIKNEREIFGDKETSFAITPKIKIRFWKYFHNKNNIEKWGCGLFRYVDDLTALAILEDLEKEYNKLKDFEKEKKNLSILIERYKKYIGG